VPEILAIAVGEKAATPENKKLCRRVLVNPVRSFALRIALYPPFAAACGPFFTALPVDRLEDITTGCLILQHYSKLTAGNFLLQFSNGAQVFQKLLDHISVSPVYDLVLFLASDGHDRFAEYFNKNRIGRLLWERYEKQTDPTLLLFLSLVVTAVGPHSPEVLYLTERPRVAKMFSLATNSADRLTCNYAMELLYELCSFCDEEDDGETSVLVRVFGYIQEHQDELANFVANDQQFCRAKTRAMELFSGLITAQDEVPESFFQAAGKLFQKLLKNPQFSELHCTAVTMFRLVMQGDEDGRKKFEEDFQIRKEIIRAFAEKTREKLYYGHLYKIVELIEEANEGEGGGQEWRDFLSGPFAEMKAVIGSSYGGPRPQKGTGKLYLSDDEVAEVVNESDDDDADALVPPAEALLPPADPK
jgi:hypothetical protein